MTAKHTQGDWKPNGIKRDNVEYVSIVTDKYEICKVNLIADVDANAKLIAAAPELLKVLQGILHTGVSYNLEAAHKIIKQATE